MERAAGRGGQAATNLRAQLLNILGAEIVTVLLAVGVVVALGGLLEPHLWSASARLFFTARDALPYPTVPFYWFFDGALWPSGVVALSLALLCNAWFWMWATDITLAASRVLARMSADRGLPSWVGDVRASSRAPGNAVLVFGGVCLVPLAMFAYTGSWRLAFAATLVSAIAFAVTCSAMACLPFVNPELYRSSPGAAHQLLRVPLVTMAGAVFVALACSCWCASRSTSASPSGAATSHCSLGGGVLSPPARLGDRVPRSPASSRGARGGHQTHRCRR